MEKMLEVTICMTVCWACIFCLEIIGFIFYSLDLSDSIIHILLIFPSLGVTLVLEILMCSVILKHTKKTRTASSPKKGFMLLITLATLLMIISLIFSFLGFFRNIWLMSAFNILFLFYLGLAVSTLCLVCKMPESSAQRVRVRPPNASLDFVARRDRIQMRQTRSLEHFEEQTRPGLLLDSVNTPRRLQLATHVINNSVRTKNQLQ